MLFQRLDDTGHRGPLLPDRHIDAEDIQPLLVNDRVHRDRRLAGLTVTDDQLALSPSDGDHGIDGLDSCLQGLPHRLPFEDAGRAHFDEPGLGRLDRALAVQRSPNRIHDTADERAAHGNLCDATGPFDRIALLDAGTGAHEHGADVILFEIERNAIHAAGEFEHLAGHRAFQAVDFGDVVADLEHGPDLGHVHLLLEGLDLIPDDCADLFRFDLHP